MKSCMKVCPGCSDIDDSLVYLLVPLDAGKNVEDRARWLMSHPPIRELELPEKAGGPTRNLMKKLGLDY